VCKAKSSSQELLGRSDAINFSAIVEHPLFKPPPFQHPTLYFTWDFVMRSKYMLSEYDNIRAGRPLQHPQQFQGGAGENSSSFKFSFQSL
jgi:hypothetical protein